MATSLDLFPGVVRARLTLPVGPRVAPGAPTVEPARRPLVASLPAGEVAEADRWSQVAQRNARHLEERRAATTDDLNRRLDALRTDPTRPRRRAASGIATALRRRIAELEEAQLLTLSDPDIVGPEGPANPEGPEETDLPSPEARVDDALQAMLAVLGELEPLSQDLLDGVRDLAEFPGFELPGFEPDADVAADIPAVELAPVAAVVVAEPSPPPVGAEPPPPPVDAEPPPPSATAAAPPIRRRRRWVAAIVAGFVAVGTGGLLARGALQADDDGFAGAVPPRPIKVAGTTSTRSFIATARVETLEVFDRPGDTTARLRLANPTESGAPLVMLVDGAIDSPWLTVYLPIRPNQSQGFIRRDDVDLTVTTYQIVVSLGQHRLWLREGTETVFETPVAIGTTDTPTPGGVFYVKELIQPVNSDTIYGDYAYGLSGFSNTIQEFNDGQGVVGIHGTNDPASIGRDVSLGCIRLRNEDIQELVRRVPLGTPVTIET